MCLCYVPVLCAYLLVAPHFLLFASLNALYEQLLFSFLPQDHIYVAELPLVVCPIVGFVRMLLVFLILFRGHVPRHFFSVLQFRYFVVRLLLFGGQLLFFFVCYENKVLLSSSLILCLFCSP